MTTPAGAAGAQRGPELAGQIVVLIGGSGGPRRTSRPVRSLVPMALPVRGANIERTC
jgi:hypothetical protein